MSVTYNKSPNLPKAVGTYDVKVTINDSLYSGSESARLTIYKGQAEVAFDAESLGSSMDRTLLHLVCVTNLLVLQP